MAKKEIGYGDKVTGGIPKDVHEQQWWFDDANEVKDTVNDNSTELYDRTDGNSPHQVIHANVIWANLSETVQEQDLIWAAVNADLTTIVKHNHDLIFRTVRKVYGQVGSIKTYDVYETYWRLRDKLTVIGGSNVSLGSGNTQLDSTNGIMTFAGRKITKVVDGVIQEGGFTVDFGSTGATPIEDSVNSGASYETGKGLFLFKGNDGTDDYLYIYSGVEEKIGSGSGVTTSATDFSILTEGTSDSAPTDGQTIKIKGDTGEGEFPLAIDFVGADVTRDGATDHAIVTIAGGNSKWLDGANAGFIYSPDIVSVGVDNPDGGLFNVGDTLGSDTTDATIVMRHTFDDANGSGNAHGISDTNIIKRGGDMAYAGFNCVLKVASGTEIHDHFAAFQAGMNFQSSGLIDNIYGMYLAGSVKATSSATNAYQIRIQDWGSTGDIDKNYGIWINPIDRGTSYNAAIKTNGGLVDFGGPNSAGSDIEEFFWSRETVAAGDSQFAMFRASTTLGGGIKDKFTSTNNHSLGIFGSDNSVKTIGVTVQYDGTVWIGDTPPDTAVDSLITVDGLLNIKGYTVDTLPTGVTGDTAYVTDAVAPTYLGSLTGGGSVECPVFKTSTGWVSH